MLYWLKFKKACDVRRYEALADYVVNTPDGEEVWFEVPDSK